MACTPKARSPGFGRRLCLLLALGDAGRSSLRNGTDSLAKVDSQVSHF